MKKEKIVVIQYDSDIVYTKSVEHALEELKGTLPKQCPEILFLILPKGMDVSGVHLLEGDMK